jgi:hypothetical protein
VQPAQQVLSTSRQAQFSSRAGRAGVHQSSSAIVSFDASIVVGEPRFRALPEKLIRLELEREHRTRTAKLNCLPVEQSRTPTLLASNTDANLTPQSAGLVIAFPQI